MRISEVFRGYREASFPGLVELSETARVSEFAGFLAKGLKTELLKQYGMYIGTTNWLFTVVPSDMHTETWPKLSAPDLPLERMAGGEFVRIGFNSESVSLTNKEYGAIMEIDRFLIDTDQTRMINQIPGKMGEAMARGDHKIAYDFFNGGAAALGYDAVFIFAAAAADHPNVTGGAANTDNTNSLGLGALSEANYETALANIQLWKGIFGENLETYPVGVVTGTTDQFTAQRLFKDPIRVPAAATTFGHERNIFGPVGPPYGNIEVQFDKMLTAASWYVKTNILGFVNQELTGVEVAKEMDEAGLSFETRVFRYRVYRAGRMGCVDWRQFCKGN